MNKEAITLNYYPNYKNVTNVPVDMEKKLSLGVNDLLLNQIGFFVFDLSILFGLHTLMLHIDNTNLEKPKYYLSDQLATIATDEEQIDDEINKKVIYFWQWWYNGITKYNERKGTNRSPKSASNLELWKLNSI